MTLNDEIESMLSGTEAPEQQRVTELAARYPYFTLPSVLMAKRGGMPSDPDMRRSIMTAIALNSPDATAMRQALDPDADDMANFYPPEPTAVTPSTDDTISKFLDTYGSTDPREEEMLTRMIFNPVPDYAQQLAREEELNTPKPDEAPAGSQDSLINDFILKSRAADGHFPPVDTPAAIESKPQPEHTQPLDKPERTDDSMLSESLAKMYIAQHRYAKAYEIISNLNLNFPEKSIYFADQLRFLSKLMLIQQHIDGAQQQ
ncbi:MAG: hypothetical protein K2M76_06850 [Muribaculaceae bacterium]|nr:hypothetical protein [Muribaculaceae bacterium]